MPSAGTSIATKNQLTVPPQTLWIGSKSTLPYSLGRIGKGDQRGVENCLYSLNLLDFFWLRAWLGRFVAAHQDMIVQSVGNKVFFLL